MLELKLKVYILCLEFLWYFLSYWFGGELLEVSVGEVRTEWEM